MIALKELLRFREKKFRSHAFRCPHWTIRWLYVCLHPLLDPSAHSQRIQWIMRDSPLVVRGVPFFFEPWVNPDNYMILPKPSLLQVSKRFWKEFKRWLKFRTGRLQRKEFEDTFQTFEYEADTIFEETLKIFETLVLLTFGLDAKDLDIPS